MEPLLVKKRKGMREVRIVSHLVFAPQLLSKAVSMERYAITGTARYKPQVYIFSALMGHLFFFFLHNKNLV